MFQTEVGDDVYGDDVAINELKQLAAHMFIKKKA
ncbi:hypothetical protein [Anaerotignum sp.]|nr:hypothetical protein [Anaerotignum sp.]